MTNPLPLDSWHRGQNARMVSFAGYEMPIQYEGIIAEHLWTRQSAGLFDVSHMGQISVTGADAGADVAGALEALMPGDFAALREGRARYSMLLDAHGGIIDDLIVTNAGDHYVLVVNGATKSGDLAHLRAHLPDSVSLHHHEDRALLALQGPKAKDVLSGMIDGVDALGFMQAMRCDWRGANLWVSRSGYTGEDGFEISLPGASAEAFAEALMDDDRVRPIGLGARDSLRLEAGLPLYGHDLDLETSPVMADLGFAISKRRRAEGGFPGAERIMHELDHGAPLKRVGFLVDGRQPVREGAMLLDEEGNEVGKITSGGHSPSLERPIAMGYLAAHLAREGGHVQASQRGKIFNLTVTAMPFVAHQYFRKSA